jgi:Protein of unknown function (DUF2934)
MHVHRRRCHSIFEIHRNKELRMKPASATIDSPSPVISTNPSRVPAHKPSQVEDAVVPKDSTPSEHQTSQSPSVAHTSASQQRPLPGEEQIRQKAYELYVEGGYCDGRAEEDWFAAERELTKKND